MEQGRAGCLTLADHTWDSHPPPDALPSQPAFWLPAYKVQAITEAYLADFNAPQITELKWPWKYVEYQTYSVRSG